MGWLPCVEMVPNQVMGEMVLDRGGRFIPAGIFSFHTLSLLLASLVAHDRATVDTHAHTGKKHKTRQETLSHRVPGLRQESCKPSRLAYQRVPLVKRCPQTLPYFYY